MIGFGYNRNTKKIDISGDYEMLKVFCDLNCYEILTEEELEKRGIKL